MSEPLRFPFHTVRLPLLGTMRRPVVLATLAGPTRNAKALFLIDSGADVSLVPHELGRLLGLSRAGAPQGLCRGIGRGAVGYSLCPVGLQIGHLRVRIRIGWCEADGFPALLGRLDVFDLLDIEFCQSSNRIVLRPAGPADRP